jgi:hypothetical protein
MILDLRCTALSRLHVLLIPILFLIASPGLAASVTTTGLVSNAEGTIGHGSIEPEPAPFDASNTSVQLGGHLQGGLLAGIYTLLASRDVFNTTDGTEAPLSAHVAPFLDMAPRESISMHSA